MVRLFDATRHLLDNHLVEADDDRGEVSRDVSGDSPAGRPFGSPRRTLGRDLLYRFVEADTGWPIDTPRMRATRAEGNEILVIRCPRRAAA
ncbi:hypothetical protein [Nocardia gamkensis]|uniref:hypothetical protein n=1 Tax=Nocardia gamkensis TaxID=352869 RepID=UPI0037C97D27